MAITYTDGSPLDRLDPVNLAQQLSEAVTSSLPWLEGLSGSSAGQPTAPGKWSPKEVLGHLIDSAVNNLDRIVRLETAAEEATEVHSPGYEQEAWVRAQLYADKPWSEIVGLWRALNEHLAWTISHVSRCHLGRVCVFPDSQMTFGFLIEDYIAHLGHHLKALRSAVPD
jgi:hypothetical protein